MNAVILSEAGIAYEEGVRRFSGKAVLYEKYVDRFLTDDTFDSMKQAIREKKFDTAFRRGHDLKGLVGNLSFNRLFEKMCVEVEYLRNGKDFVAAETFFPELEAEYKNTLDAIRRATV